MLEDWALWYVNQPEDTMRSIAYGLTVLGGIVAGLTHRSTAELRRAPYFAYTALFFLLSAASQLIWLASIPALSGGYVWAFMLMDVLVSLAFGYSVAVIAMARSRDAYGHGRRAFLAFIPIANFWLLLTRSRQEDSPNRLKPNVLLRGGLGVLSAFVMLVLGVSLTAFLRVETERMAAVAQDDPAMQEMGIDFMIRSTGLEGALKEMALGVPVPSRVDEATTIVKIEGLGTTLRYTYEVTAAADFLPVSMRTGLTEQNCTYPALRPVIEAGATLEHLYIRPDGSEIGVVQVDRSVCGF